MGKKIPKEPTIPLKLQPCSQRCVVDEDFMTRRPKASRKAGVASLRAFPWPLLTRYLTARSRDSQDKTASISGFGYRPAKAKWSVGKANVSKLILSIEFCVKAFPTIVL